MRNFYQQASFSLSTPWFSGCPADDGFEVVFVGRSNSGKSSVINALTQQKKLAHVSKTPGRTQHFVFFTLDDERRLVDLPGYGYAKVPLAMKKRWRFQLDKFFIKRQSIYGIVLIMDSRHPLQAFDQQILKWAQYRQTACHILLNKADKLSNNKAKQALLSVQKQVKPFAHTSVQLFSSLKKQGLDELTQTLDVMLSRSVQP